jgi:O-methyltransferase
MDISLLKKTNRRVRMFGLFPFTERLGEIMAISKAKPYTMVNYPRLAKAYELIYESERYNNLDGAIVEPGCWNGGFARLMQLAAAHAGKSRDVWLFDSFEGGPPPLDIDRKVTGKLGKGEPNGADPELCRQAFKGSDPAKLHIVKGWFEDTFPKTLPQIKKIAYLHLDADFYEATKFCLEQMYDMVVPGGLIIFDDYSYFLGCKKAVDEFLESRGIQGGLVQTVEHSAYFRKPS